MPSCDCSCNVFPLYLIQESDWLVIVGTDVYQVVDNRDGDLPSHRLGCAILNAKNLDMSE